MRGSLLITRPEHEPAMRYLSRWSEKIIKEAKEKGVKVIDLYRNKANRKRVIGILEKRNPKLVVFNGHGGEDFVTGHDNEVILKNDDEEAVNSKIIFARSCKSAKVLGATAIKRGAIAYLGYKEDFWLVYNILQISRPLEDKTAALFLAPSNYVPIALLKGHSTGEADNKSKNLFRKNIEKLIIEGPSSDDYYAIRYLLWDMIHQVCLGNQVATF